MQIAATERDRPPAVELRGVVLCLREGPGRARLGRASRRAGGVRGDRRSQRRRQDDARANRARAAQPDCGGDVPFRRAPLDGFSRRATLGYLAQRSQTRYRCTGHRPRGRLRRPAGRGRAVGRCGGATARSSTRRSGASVSEGSTPPAGDALGGQQQRAFIAKALAAEPSLLVLDEPTAGVDVDAQEALASLLAALNRDCG